MADGENKSDDHTWPPSSCVCGNCAEQTRAAIHSDPLLWTILSTSAALTTRILSLHFDQLNASTPLLAHLLAALAVHVARRGSRSFTSLGMVNRAARKQPDLVSLLRIAGYLICTTFSLLCGYQALVDLPILSPLAALFVVTQAPHTLFKMVFAFLCCGERCILIVIVSLLCALLFGVITSWSFVSTNLATVAIGLVSSACAGLAKILYSWTVGFHTSGREREDFHAFVLCFQVSVAFGAFLLSEHSFHELKRMSWPMFPLLVVNACLAAGAMDLNASIFMPMRRSLFASLGRTKPTAVHYLQYAVLIVAEALLASSCLSPLEVVSYITFTIMALVLQDDLGRVALWLSGSLS